MYAGKKKQQNPLLRLIRSPPLKICLPRSAFAFFVAAMGADPRKKTMNDDAFATECKKMWKELSEPEKQTYIQKSLKDDSRFEADMLRAYSGAADVRWAHVTAEDIHEETSSILQDCITALCTVKAQEITALPPATQMKLLQVREEIETLQKDIFGKCDCDAAQGDILRLQKRYSLCLTTCVV